MLLRGDDGRRRAHHPIPIDRAREGLKVGLQCTYHFGHEDLQNHFDHVSMYVVMSFFEFIYTERVYLDPQLFGVSITGVGGDFSVLRKLEVFPFVRDLVSSK